MSNKLKYLLSLLCTLVSINSYTIEKEKCEPNLLEFHSHGYANISLFNMWYASSTAKENIQECAKLYEDEETAFALLIQSIVDFYNHDIELFYKKIKASANMDYSPAQYYLSIFYAEYSKDREQYMYWLSKAKLDENFPIHLLHYSSVVSDTEGLNEAIQLLYDRATIKKNWINTIDLVRGYNNGIINTPINDIDTNDLVILSETTLNELLKSNSGRDILYYAQTLMDLDEQIETLKTSAEKDMNKAAMIALYSIYKDEIYNSNEASKWWQNAIDNDHEVALDMYVREYIYENNELPYEESLKTLKENFNNGYIFSAYILGEAYKNGEIRFPKNMDKAIEWYEKAAEYDQVGALSALVRIYEDQGNEEKLAYYLKKLATHPHPEHSKTAKAKLENLEK